MQELRQYVKEKAPISKVQKHVQSLESAFWREAIDILVSDERKGIVALREKLETLILKEEQEKLRVYTLFSFEREANASGFLKVAGVDEVGRGPLAGPVVAAAVILPPDEDWTSINDSKKLSEAKREELYERIIDKALAYGVGLVDCVKIDEVNILEATKLAMKEAISKVNPDFLLIDALTLDDIPIKQRGIVKGDTLSASIAAASIVAKVTRDRYMVALHEKYPMYDFVNNKGYGTPLHYEGIKKFGLIDEHRRSFLKNME